VDLIAYHCSMKQLTKVEIIDLIFTNGYEKKPESRAINVTNSGYQSGCFYYDKETNRKCAVGACMNAKGINDYGEFGGSVEGLSETIKNGTRNQLDDYLYKKYSGHSIDFWLEVQALHDVAAYWDEKGLNLEGKRVKDQLIEDHSE